MVKDTDVHKDSCLQPFGKCTTPTMQFHDQRPVIEETVSTQYNYTSVGIVKYFSLQ